MKEIEKLEYDYLAKIKKVNAETQVLVNETFAKATLQNTYVPQEVCPLRVKSSRTSEESSSDEAVNREPVLLETAADIFTHLVIFGPAGAGKSTALQFLASKLAHNVSAPIRSYPSKPIVLVWPHPRKDDDQFDRKQGVKKVLAASVVEAIKSTHKQAGQLIDRWLEDRRLVLLVDLEEFSVLRREEMALAIQEFASGEGQNCRIIVASRPTHYYSFGHPFRQYELVPFKDRDKKEDFVVKWIRALSKDEVTVQESRQEAIDLLTQLSQKEVLHQASSNPFLLRLVVSVYSAYRVIPNRIHHLFEREFNQRYDRAKKHEADAPEKEALEKALMSIAWELSIRQSERQGDSGEAINVEFDRWEAINAKFGREVNFARTALGLIEVAGEFGPIKFSRDEFAAYFLASILKNWWLRCPPNEPWSFIKPRLHCDGWTEPIKLFASILEDQQSTQLLHRILSAKSLYEEVLHRDLLLAGECLRYGARSAEKLRHTILDSLLDLYLENKPSPTGHHSVSYRSYFRSESLAIAVEVILRSIPYQDYLIKSVIAIANGKIAAQHWHGQHRKPTWCPTSGLHAILRRYHWHARKLLSQIRYGAFLVRSIAHSNSELSSGLLSPVKKILLLASGYGLLLPMLAFLPRDYQRELRQHRIRVRHAAVETLLLFDNHPEEAIEFLVSNLHTPTLGGICAVVLGQVGPRRSDIVDALIGMLSDRRYNDSLDTHRRVAQSLGVLGQRYAEVTETLIQRVQDVKENPDLCHRLVEALFKAAEVSVTAMDFMLQCCQRIQDDAATADESGLLGGFQDGSMAFETASNKIVEHLIRICLNHDHIDVRRIEASSLLKKVLYNNPLGPHKILAEGGRIAYRTSGSPSPDEDGTSIIDIFGPLVMSSLKQAPTEDSVHSPFLSILVNWGLERTELITKFVRFALGADRLILAERLGYNFSRDPGRRFMALFPVLAPEQEALIKDQIRILQSDSDEGVFLYQLWLQRSRDAVEGDSLYGLETRIQYAKWAMLEAAYREAESQIGPYHTLWNPSSVAPAVIVAALGTFRGLRIASFIEPPLNAKEVATLLDWMAEKALSVLTSPSDELPYMLRTLTSFLKREQPPLLNEGILQTVAKNGSKWDDRVMHSFYESVVAARALVSLGGQYQEAQQIVLYHLDVTAFEVDEPPRFQEDLLKAMKQMVNADAAVIEALVILRKRAKYFGWSPRYLLQDLRRPSVEAVLALITSYADLDREGQIDIIKILGTLEKPPTQAVRFLLGLLDDRDTAIRSLAAGALANISTTREPPEVAEIYEKLILAAHDTVGLLPALDSYSQRVVQSLGGGQGKPDKEELSRKLEEIVSRQWRLLRNTSEVWWILDYDFAFEESLEGLRSVVAQLTELRATFSQAIPPPLVEKSRLDDASSVPTVRSWSPIKLAGYAIALTIVSLLSDLTASLIEDVIPIRSPVIRYTLIMVFILAIFGWEMFRLLKEKRNRNL